MWLLVFRAHPFAAVALLGASESYVGLWQRASAGTLTFLLLLLLLLQATHLASSLPLSEKLSASRCRMCSRTMAYLSWASGGLCLVVSGHQRL